jgi:hypothetical protein
MTGGLPIGRGVGVGLEKYRGWGVLIWFCKGGVSGVSSSAVQNSMYIRARAFIYYKGVAPRWGRA